MFYCHLLYDSTALFRRFENIICPFCLQFENNMI